MSELSKCVKQASKTGKPVPIPQEVMREFQAGVAQRIAPKLEEIRRRRRKAWRDPASIIID